MIIKKAIQRSHGNIDYQNNNIYYFISPTKADEDLIKNIINNNNNNSKILILGKISNELAKLLGLKHNDNKIVLNELTYDHQKYEDKSNLNIKYNYHLLNKNNPLSKRYFYRFDFTDEWNNLGYGAITTDNTIWSISNSLEIIDATSLADIYEKDSLKSVFISLKEYDTSSILYINREVGNVDGLDWSIVEDFLYKYKIKKLPSLPLICDIPYGYNGIASSRLDCDQSIINTKPLVDLYKKYNINLSLAIATGININSKDIEFLNQFYNNGGAILSHTVNHHEFWGEKYDVVYKEAKESKQWIEQNVINLKELKYAVSPFHSNKPYSIQALADIGYKGFISGIIHNDPEYLVATSGEVSFVDKKIVTHSQQCMLHGDCYKRSGLDIYKKSFENHYKAKKMFGYLDHPFGDYDYGWSNEDERLEVHQKFIEYINSFENIKWMSATEILDFVVDKSNIDINIDKEDNIKIKRNSFNSPEKIQVIYKNKEYIL
jgi:hypothetical protein